MKAVQTAKERLSLYGHFKEIADQHRPLDLREQLSDKTMTSLAMKRYQVSHPRLSILLNNFHAPPGSERSQSEAAADVEEIIISMQQITDISSIHDNFPDLRGASKQHSGFSDEDISDIICVLYPHSENARYEVEQLASINSSYIISTDEADGIQPDRDFNDHELRSYGNHAILLRLSSKVNPPAAGFNFGRNNAECDIAFVNDPPRRISNVHFRIYVNKYGVVMIEDKSTNGTFVNNIRLASVIKKSDQQPTTGQALSSGAIICIYLHNQIEDVSFQVRIPHRNNECERAYMHRLEEYFAHQYQSGSKDSHHWTRI
ncbi:hypothetical protein V8C35DRAFT_282025 [Trichoderma chlorosporum]